MGPIVMDLISHFSCSKGNTTYVANETKLMSIRDTGF